MLMIEWISPNETTLGQYVIITKISTIFFVLSQAISFLITPYLPVLHDNDRLKSLQKHINFKILLSILWLIICISGFLLFKGMIFKAYNINFNHASFVIILSITGNFIFSLTATSETICSYNHMNRALYPISFIQVISISVLCYFLIPPFSFLGAIYAYFISETFCSAICWFIVRSHGIEIKILGFI